MKTYTLTLLSIGASLGASAFAGPDEAKPKPPKPPHRMSFEEADKDKNGGLDVFEFATTQGPGTPLVEIRKRFLPIDVSGDFEIIVDPVTGEPALDPITGEPLLGDPIPDGLISLDELKAYRALEEKPKSALNRFELADFDGDGQLSPVELGYLVSPKVPNGKTMRKFTKLDDNDDGYISPLEFKKSKSDDV